VEQRKKTRYQVEFNPGSYSLAIEKLVTDSGVAMLYDTRFARCVGMQIASRISSSRTRADGARSPVVQS